MISTAQGEKATSLQAHSTSLFSKVGKLRSILVISIEQNQLPRFDLAKDCPANLPSSRCPEYSLHPTSSLLVLCYSTVPYVYISPTILSEVCLTQLCNLQGKTHTTLHKVILNVLGRNKWGYKKRLLRKETQHTNFLKNSRHCHLIFLLSKIITLMIQ